MTDPEDIKDADGTPSADDQPQVGGTAATAPPGTVPETPEVHRLDGAGTEPAELLDGPGDSVRRRLAPWAAAVLAVLVALVIWRRRA